MNGPQLAHRSPIIATTLRTKAMRRISIQAIEPTTISMTVTVICRFCWVTAPADKSQAVPQSAITASVVQTVGAFNA